MKIEVYKHEETGSLFEREEDYLKCVAKYKEREEKRKEQERIMNAHNKKVNRPRLEATSIRDFIDRCIELWNTENAPAKIILTEINLYFTTVNDGHYCPIGKPAKDEEGDYIKYPGWKGEIRVSIEEKTGRSPSPMQIYRPGKTIFGEHIPGFHNSGGGGGFTSYRFNGCIFYLSDFPLVEKERIELEKQWTELKEEIAKVNQEDQDYVMAVDKYVRETPDCIQRMNQIDDLNTQILKLTEAVGICRSALECYAEEETAKYHSLYPYDMGRRQKLLTEKALIDAKLK